MDTPIIDFVRKYSDLGTHRFHMPGHKGRELIGIEAYDITEISGADSLYEADGIIRESEQNASLLFGADTYYSTEGSSQCIRAMIYLALMDAKGKGLSPRILACRNAHKTFISAISLLDAETDWHMGMGDSYLSCPIDFDTLETELKDGGYTAFYVSSPDYLGNIQNIGRIADICHRYGVMLLVDNAHGAYLRFLTPSLHPIDLGADIVCDSAHKTLPAITGAAYLHISKKCVGVSRSTVKEALALFGSTSPSYLILQSLDALNAYIADGYGTRLSALIDRVRILRGKLTDNGYVLIGNEEIKLTIDARAYGYYGYEIADILRREHSVECEFADTDYIVLMLSTENGEGEIEDLCKALISIERKAEIIDTPPAIFKAKRVLSTREATLSPFDTVPVEKAEGKILAQSSASCPPAVPIVVPGELICADAIKAFKYYGISECKVVK